MEVIASTIFLSLAIFKTVPFIDKFIIYYIIIIIIISLAQLMRGVKGKHGKPRAVSALEALSLSVTHSQTSGGETPFLRRATVRIWNPSLRVCMDTSLNQKNAQKTG
jgi:hypothetical protein